MRPVMGFELKSSIQIASLFHTYIDMDERISGEQDRQNQKFEYHQGPSNNQKYIYFLHFIPYIKNWFSIVFPCTYVSTVMRSPFADILVIDYLPQLTRKPHQTQYKVKSLLVQTLLRMTHIDHRKSYIVIVCPHFTYKVDQK